MMYEIRKYLNIFLGLLRLIREEIWNSGKIKLHGCRYYIGKNVKVRISKGREVDLGTKTWIENGTYISAGGNIKIGYNNYFNTNCKLVAMAGITIGDNNLFGPNVVIVDHNHNFSEEGKLICEQGFRKHKIDIGSDIWIGSNSVICSGVSICDHVVIGANSVVFRNIMESGVYVGNPARFLKKLREASL